MFISSYKTKKTKIQILKSSNRYHYQKNLIKYNPLEYLQPFNKKVLRFCSPLIFFLSSDLFVFQSLADRINATYAVRKTLNRLGLTCPIRRFWFVGTSTTIRFILSIFWYITQMVQTDSITPRQRQTEFQSSNEHNPFVKIIILSKKLIFIKLKLYTTRSIYFGQTSTRNSFLCHCLDETFVKEKLEPWEWVDEPLLQYVGILHLNKRVKNGNFCQIMATMGSCFINYGKFKCRTKWCSITMWIQSFSSKEESLSSMLLK